MAIVNEGLLSWLLVEIDEAQRLYDIYSKSIPASPSKDSVAGRLQALKQVAYQVLRTIDFNLTEADLLYRGNSGSKSVLVDIRCVGSSDAVKRLVGLSLVKATASQDYFACEEVVITTLGKIAKRVLDEQRD